MLLQLGLGIIALLANLLSGLAGGGAGLIQLPALIFLGLPFPIALATHKIASVALGAGAGLRHAKEKTLNSKLVLLLLISGLPGVWIGAKLVLTIPEQIATTLLGFLTLIIGLYSARKPELGTKELRIKQSFRRWLIGAVVIFLIGVLNGSLTSGTGLFVTLWLVSWFGLSYTKAVAHTLILVGLFWNGMGAMVLGINGEINWSWLPSLIVGSILGGYLGAHFSLKKGSKLVKTSFEAISVLIGTSLLLRGII